jgi:hypothetical protein
MVPRFSVSLFAVQAPDALQEAFFRLFHVSRWSGDGDQVVLVTRRRYHDVDTISVHHVAHRLPFPADDVPVEFEGDLHRIGDGDQCHEGSVGGVALFLSTCGEED